MDTENHKNQKILFMTFSKDFKYWIYFNLSAGTYAHFVRQL